MVSGNGEEWCEEDSKAMDLEMLRDALISEFQAVNQYREQADMLDDEEAREVVQHIVSEEKEHIAELMKLVLRLDPEQAGKFKELGL